MVLPPSLSRKMGEIETVEAEKMGWLDLPRGTSYPTFPYSRISMTSFRHIYMKNKREILRQSIKLSQGKPNPKNVLFRQAFIDIPMLTSIDLGKRTSLHTMESQGRSQDFPLGGANLEKVPCQGYPLKLRTPRI